MVTSEIPEDQVPWSSIHALWILGSAFEEYNEALAEAELNPGPYINRSGDGLFLIYPEEAGIQSCLDRCGSVLRSLMLYNTELPILNASSLTLLERLHAENDSELSEIRGLAQLSSLTELYLCSCSKLTQLPGLENLKQLTTLGLAGCDVLRELPPLDHLSQLTTLNLSSCHSLRELPTLDHLSQLTTLNLSSCRSLRELPTPDHLSQLTTLNLSYCYNLRELPPLDHLSRLTTLNLSHCDTLCEPPTLDHLSQLTTLNLSYCYNLRELPPLDHLSRLITLNLSGCGIRELPEGIRSMKSLRVLELMWLELRTLPDWLSEIAECFSLDWRASDAGENKAIVYLHHTTVEDIPDMSIFEQPYEMVVDFFRNRAMGQTHPLNEIKVVFLGDGEAGKSHTIARLMNDGGEPDYAVFDGQSTPGIVIRNKEYDLGDRRITVHYWDFGGQEIMHSMHRIFLTGRTMYVILLNARDDTQSDRARYWLHNVKSFAPDAPVLLVLNKIDQNEKASVDEVYLRGRYDKLTQVVRLSALKYTQAEFNERFRDILLEEIQKTGYLDAQWPTTWTKVKGHLETMKDHYIKGNDYLRICKDCNVDQNQKDLLHWFNDLGVSFCCDGEDDYTLEDYVILRPDWITNALYIILFNPLAGARNGLIPHRSIYSLLKNFHNDPAVRCTLPQARYASGDIYYVLCIMRKFNLSFPHGQAHEFIPMLCQQNSMVDVQYYQRDAEILEFNMEFDYLPNNLLHRLMVERHSELDIERVWRTGASFRLEELGYSAVVVIDSNTLRFFIRHTDPMYRPNTYLTMLKAHVERIVAKMGLKAPTCQLIYKLDGKRDTFDLDILRMRLDVGQTHELAPSHKKLIPIADILNQSAPDGLADEQKLLDAIIKACRQIQAEPDYCLNNAQTGRGMEDKRNRRVRDALELLGYDVKDQTQRGHSGTGKGIGEPDLLICSDAHEPWTIIEALRISGKRKSGKSKSDWDKHLDKLSVNYNPSGFPVLYLLTYVDADIPTFPEIWKDYREYIQTHDPAQRRYVGGSFLEVDVPNCQHIKVGKCRYSGGDPITVYHIFTRIPTENG